MKQKLYSLFLIVLIGLLGNNVQVWAQDVPEPTAQWNFNDPDNLMTPDKGSLVMTPCVLGTRNVSPSTLDAAGIYSTDGPDETNKAIYDEMFKTYRRLYKDLKKTYKVTNSKRFGGEEYHG